jgi:hypothetical protein
MNYTVVVLGGVLIRFPPLVLPPRVRRRTLVQGAGAYCGCGRKCPAQVGDGTGAGRESGKGDARFGYIIQNRTRSEV